MPLIKLSMRCTRPQEPELIFGFTFQHIADIFLNPFRKVIDVPAAGLSGRGSRHMQTGQALR